MQPAILNDLLDLADSGKGEQGAGSLAAEFLPELSLSLVVLARFDGTVRLSEGLASIEAEIDVAPLVRDAVRALRDVRQAMWQPDAERPRKLCVASRLGASPTNGIVCCLVELATDLTAGTNRLSVRDIASVALATALLRKDACLAELSARVEQLVASQEALRTSNTRSLAETIEEHTLRPRHEELAQRELRRGHTVNQLILNSAGEGTFEASTERKLLESQLLQAQKMESIGQLAAGIAHEVNTPTQFVGDNLRFLQQAFAQLRPVLEAAIHPGHSAPKVSGIPLPATPEGVTAPPADWLFLLDEIPNAISQSLEGLAHVARIVQSMPEFSHPGTDQMHSVDLHKILDNAINVCRHVWKFTARVVRNFDPNLPLVMCYPSACQQVFLNLIVNAAHAIADRLGPHPELLGQITVATRIAGDWVEVRVSDTGTGIRPEIQPRVFEPFFTTKAEGQGTGQGLAIARSVIVDKHHGCITFKTVPGEGTTFIVRLPEPGGSTSTNTRQAIPNLVEVFA